jgi:acyl-CoA synthetase (AMP-forming)/AMP-acid ligase II
VVLCPFVAAEADVDLSSLGPNALFLSQFLSKGENASGDYDPLVFEQVPFDHPLFIMFSSGTTGAPKAMVHSVGVRSYSYRCGRCTSTGTETIGTPVSVPKQSVHRYRYRNNRYTGTRTETIGTPVSVPKQSVHRYRCRNNRYTWTDHIYTYSLNVNPLDD